MSDSARPPVIVNPLPASVVALAVVIFGLECLFSLMDRGLIGGATPIGRRQAALELYAFHGAAFDWMLETRRFPPELLAQLLTYPLIHLSFTQTVMACVFILAIGKMVGEAFGNVSVLVLFFAGAIAGAVTYALVLDEAYPLIGAFPGIYSLIGGFTFMKWVHQKAMGDSQAKAFQLIGFLLGIQILFGMIFGTHFDWVADVAGFVAGFLLSFLLVPGGWARIREMLRNR